MIIAPRKQSHKLYADHGMGKRIAQAREDADLSQDELGALLGITGSAVSQWESGRTAPTRARLVEIARIVQRTPNWLQFALDDDGPGPRLVPKLTFAEAIQEPPL